MTRFYSEIEGLLRDAGIPEADRTSFRPEFPTDTEPPLTRREAELRRSVAQRDGTAENPAEATIRWLQTQISALEKLDSADKARQEKIKIIQTRIAAIGTEIERIQAEIARIEGPDKARLAAARQERLDTYVAFFQNLKQEQQAMEELYGPVKTTLSSGSASEQEQDLEFSIRWEADLERWLERGSPLFDQRKTMPYGTMHGLGYAALQILAPAWTSGNPEQIRAALETFLASFESPTFRHVIIYDRV